MNSKEQNFSDILNEISTWEYGPINELIGNINEKTELMKRLILIGPTQVGKTTLITSLIGIKDDQKRKVDRLLRGGTKQGKSSTSTAIIYSRSPKEPDSPDYEKFGWATGKLTDSVSELDFVYYSDEEIIEIISSTNEENRNNNVYIDSDVNLVTYIQIPAKYFNDDAPKNLHLVDLPGFGDRSGKMQKKIKSTIDNLSDFTAGIVAVVSSETINSLSNVYKEYIYDKAAESVVVAVTYSVSKSDAVRKLIDQTSDIADLETGIKKFYVDEICNAEESCHHDIENFKERIFPIESKSWLENNGFDRVKELVDYQKKSILEAIAKMECRTGIDICSQNISKSIASLNQSIKESEQNIERANGELEKLNKRLDAYANGSAELKNQIRESEDKIDQKGYSLSEKLSKLKVSALEKRYPIKAEDLYLEVGKNEKSSISVKERFLDFLINMSYSVIENMFEGYGYDCTEYFKVAEKAINSSFAKYESEITTPEKDGLFFRTFGRIWAEKAVPICYNLLESSLHSVSIKFFSVIQKQRKVQESKTSDLKKKLQDLEKTVNIQKKEIDKHKHIIDETIQYKNECEKEAEILKEKKEHVTDVFIRHFNIKFGELTQRINNETDQDILYALITVRSAIANSMRSAVNNMKGNM